MRYRCRPKKRPPRPHPASRPRSCRSAAKTLKQFFDQFGGDIFGGGAGFLSGANATATPPPPGKVGKAVRSGNFELLVNSVADPYPHQPTSYPDATRGKRWLLVDVSLKNVSSKSQNYGSFDFTLRDTDSFQYDSTFVSQPHEFNFGSLTPGETIRGDLGFELPVDASPDRLIYDPGFFGEGRIDIDLR